MRQKLCFTVVLLAIVAFSGIVCFREGWQRQKLSFPDSLDKVAVIVDGRELTLQDMAFYVAYEEGMIEEEARIYNPKDTGEFWKIFTNHTFFRKKGKQTAMDMAIHDEIFYQLALTEGMELTEEEEIYLSNSQYDFWSDLEENQRERLGIDEDALKESMQKIALGEKYQYLLAEMENSDFEDYSISGAAYQRMLSEHEYEIEDAVWDRVDFGGITVDH